MIMSVFGARARADGSGRALDALVFFVADVQTGFGPFIAVYLTLNGWSQGDIGQALSVGTAAAAISQLPGGFAVDRLRDKRLAAASAAVAVAGGAVLFALSASTAVVMTAEVLHSFASTMLGPALAAISLALVGRAALGTRLGRNARFAALGNGFAAAVLGAAGYYAPGAAVFWVTAAFAVPGLFALWRIAPADLRKQNGGAASETVPPPWRGEVLALVTDRRVLAFCLCVVLFHAANAALLPLASGLMARRAGGIADLVVSGAIVLPQAIVALISPGVGRLADTRGIRLVLALGFAAVPARAVLLAAAASDPIAVVAVQALDGLSASAFGIMVPLVAAAFTRGTGRFNLCLGAFGLAATAGATVSTFTAGRVADAFGPTPAFLTLAAFGALAVAAAWIVAPRRTAEPAGSPRTGGGEPVHGSESSDPT